MCCTFHDECACPNLKYLQGEESKMVQKSRIVSKKVQQKRYRHAYYIRNKEKENLNNKNYYRSHSKEISIQKKKYRLLNKEILNKNHSKYYRKNKSKWHDYRKLYRKKYPEKCKAHQAVYIAVKRNHLKKISSVACQTCGLTAKAYHHYAGYSKEHRLDVEPLCQECHIASERGV